MLFQGNEYDSDDDDDDNIIIILMIFVQGIIVVCRL